MNRLQGEQLKGLLERQKLSPDHILGERRLPRKQCG